MPDTRILDPLSTPGGILTLMRSVFGTMPLPLQDLQGFGLIVPAPRQVGQG